MSLAAALLITPTGQPTPGQPNASASATDGEFAALLGASTSPGGVAPVQASYPTQAPALLVDADGSAMMSALPEGDGPAPPAVAGTPAEAASASTVPAPVAASSADTSSSAHESAIAGQENPVVQNTAADAMPVMSAMSASAAATQAANVAAKPANVAEASTSDLEAGADADMDGETVAAGVSPAPAAAPPSPAAQAVQPLALGTHSGAADPAISAPASADALLELAATSDATSSEPADPASTGDAPATTPNRTASQATTTTTPQATAAPAAEATAAKPDAAALSTLQPAQSADATSSATQPADAPRTSATPQALQSAPAATIQVYSRIIERADGRSQRFEIRLDPAELGRVDVRIEIGADRKVHAVLAAHDSAALSDLMRGQRALERALTDAGIDLADQGVRFELASDNGGAAGKQNAEGDRNTQNNVWRRFDAMTMPVTPETAAAASQPSWRPQRLDLVA